MSGFFSNKTILLPYDFSDAANAAIDEALSMVDESTRIYVLHAVVPMHVISIEPGAIVDLGSDSQRIELALSSMNKRIKDKNRPIEFVARIGDPGREITEYAKEISADLIVMPSHGRTGIKGLLLGSVAERVLRLAECPVMILRHAKHD